MDLYHHYPFENPRCLHMISNAPIFELQNLEILFHGSNAIGSLVATMALNVVCET
jgi:hypothetical protein